MTSCYAWPVTVGAGADLRLHVSTEHQRFGVRMFRYGATVTEVASPGGDLPGLRVPLGRPDEAWGWPAYPIELGDDLADGVYLAVPVPLQPDGRPAPVPAGPEVAHRKDACLFILRRRAPAGRSYSSVGICGATVSGSNTTTSA